MDRFPYGRIRPTGEEFIHSPPKPENEYRFDGTFYQPGDETICELRRQTIDEFMQPEQKLGYMSLGAFQDWVELDWKTPHGTRASFDRLSDKLVEEAWIEATQEFREQPTPAERYAGASLDSSRIISELGDYLWVVTALASNSGVDIQEALRDHLHDRELRGNKKGELAIAGLDYIIASGYIPRMVQAPYIDEEEPDERFDVDGMSPHSELIFRTAALRARCDQQFGYGDEGKRIFEYWFTQFANKSVAPLVADQIMMITYYAQVWGGKTLAKVIAKNVQKLTARVQSGLVDKSDGERPPELL